MVESTLSSVPMFSSVFNISKPEEVWSPNATSVIDETRPSDDSFPSSSLEYVINHVFFAVYRSRWSDYTTENSHTLVSAVLAAARAYDQHIDSMHKPQWYNVTKMLEQLQAISKHIWELRLEKTFEEPDKLYRDCVTSQLDGMETGDILAIPAQSNVAGATFRMQEDVTVCQLFQLPGSGWLCSRLKPALSVEISNQVLRNEDFRSRIANSFAGRWRLSLHDVLAEAGHIVDPHSIIKNLTHADFDSLSQWSRSDLWLLIRISIQSSFNRSHLGHDTYKVFVLFFLCNLANYAINTAPPSILIHSMLTKILRRTKKLGASIPRWLSEAVLGTCTLLSRTLDERRLEVLDAHGSSTRWNPSQLDLSKDVQLSLTSLRDNIVTSVMNHHSHLSHTPFIPNSPLRGTLIDFVSHLDEYLHNGIQTVPSDSHGTLFDVERAVGEDIDDWVASVTNVDVACEQLTHLIYSLLSMDNYFQDSTRNFYQLSIVSLIIIELWIALDKLVIKEIPILADYSPEVDPNLIRPLLLRDALHIHRLCRAYQYLVSRHQRANKGWTVFSSEFTDKSFPCRYYDDSPHLQHLRARIQDALPSELLHAKVVVFELRCPVFLDRWRSVTDSIFIRGRAPDTNDHDTADIPVSNIPALQPHIQNQSHSLSLYTSPAPKPWVRLYYFFSMRDWPAAPFFDEPDHQLPGWEWRDASTDMDWNRYHYSTKHTSNEVLASQAACHPNFPINKFLAFAQLRSGGSLQWFNIVRELRSRSLDVRHKEVYLLLAQASSQVGPHNDYGELLWHQEIQDSLFCHTLLGELQSLFSDVGAGSLDGPAMASISLLAGVLASRSSADVSERAMQLLQELRRKTFDWVQELMYNARMSSTASEDSLGLLRDMAAVCRSTFDVGSTLAHKLLCSAENIQIALSCAMIIHMPVTLQDLPYATYSQVLFHRDGCLSFLLEEGLRSSIQGDVSSTGVDRAVQMIWPGYRTSPCRWEPLQPPNHRWIVCESAPTQDGPPHRVHVNILDGTLLVDGEPILNKLSAEVTSDPMYRELFGLRDLVVVVSDLPGMDYVTASAFHDHYIHFALRRDSYGWTKGAIIRAQRKDTDDIFEPISREELSEELPTPLLQDHVHWRNLVTSVVEIRPIKEPWKQSSDNWVIHNHGNLGQWRITNGSKFLVGIHSPTWEMISGRLRCLEDPKNLIITVNSKAFDITSPSSSLPSQPEISIILPRYGLSFFVNELGQLESRDFKDMVYDEDQCIGTLFGLVNRLILRPKTQFEVDLFPKRIITPLDFFEGFDAREQVDYYSYQADKELGCLKGNFSLPSKLHLARLHARTGSGCRIDCLTGRTGIEEAISLIWLAGTRESVQWHVRFSPTSPQMCLALARLEGAVDRFESGRPSDAYVLQDARLFPSEIAANARLCAGSKGPLVTLAQLFQECPPPNPRDRNRLPHYNHSHQGTGWPHLPNANLLRQLLSSLPTCEAAPPFHSQYISQLHDSVYQLQKTNHRGGAYRGNSEKHSFKRLRKHYVECRNGYTESLEMIKIALGPTTEFERFLDQCGQWPHITPFTLFRCIASTSPIKPTDNWKDCLISLALLALDVQRARRLLRFVLENLEDEFDKELENEGCDGWDAAEHPDWLLIQLQGDFFIRRAQADIAKEMLSARSGINTVMQVNIGEGKTSVVIPICAAALADGNQLVRIIVPKSLIPQTLQILEDRLGGLVNKPIYHLTFSRDHTSGFKQFRSIEMLHKVVRECKENCGILVMQPEHVLSFKLSCVETIDLQSTDIESRPLPEVSQIQRFFEAHACDILDESDDILSPRSQVIYTIGHESPFEGSPDRWLIVQQVLRHVKRHATLLSTPDSGTMYCDSTSPGSFPHVRILQPEMGTELISLIAQDVLRGRLPTLRIHSELGFSGAIRDFILRQDVHPDTTKLVEAYARQTTSWSSLLLLRGLFAHNILLFALTHRRWRVDYGLDPSTRPRTMLAIPYRAKDVPAETAEFGHPDVTILLTCLSYYYTGLSEEQLRTSFELMLQEDDPSSEYAQWLEDCGTVSLPSGLRELSGVNVRSLEQWITYLVPVFTRNQRAVDLYLSKVVFPKYVREFPQKISGSYWDLAEEKNHLVTGVSGTNDGQYLLPTSIIQHDPDYLLQTGTNAKVLVSLLQPENESYIVTSDQDGERWTTIKLLETIAAQNREIRVLLDVGAQILDMSNIALAKAWLDRVQSAEVSGAIYFDEYDRLMVLTRNGTTNLLSSSPLAQQLHRCIAYLDDAHTRGTDLKFPVGFRAAVTLGHKLTKDRLVQGCMRMRGLGRGHSVMFFTPYEIDQSIRHLVAKENPSIPVTTADILRWAIYETWSDIQRRAPYWAQQGMNHKSRYEAWSRFCNKQATGKDLADAWVQPEEKSLGEMYLPYKDSDEASHTMTKLSRQIRERCEILGVLSLREVHMDEEQEREVSREIERERQVMKNLTNLSPAPHSLHPHVVEFVTTGTLHLPSKSEAFRHIFAPANGPHGWSPNILATADFCKTLLENEAVEWTIDHYLRPVQWVLSGKMGCEDVLVLLSPFEADQLLPHIRVSKHVHLHLYVPRTTKRMKPADDLRLYTVPPLPSDWTPPWALIDQLNIFAGQLYLRDYASYVRLCGFLGVHTERHPANVATVVARNWFRNPDSPDEEIKNRFEGTPLLQAMKLLVARQGMDFAGTHMGRILDGWSLTESDF